MKHLSLLRNLNLETEKNSKFRALLLLPNFYLIFAVIVSLYLYELNLNGVCFERLQEKLAS